MTVSIYSQDKVQWRNEEYIVAFILGDTASLISSEGMNVTAPVEELTVVDSLIGRLRSSKSREELDAILAGTSVSFSIPKKKKEPKAKKDKATAVEAEFEDF